MKTLVSISQSPQNCVATRQFMAVTLVAIAVLVSRAEVAAQTPGAAYAVSYFEVETGAAAEATQLFKKYRDASRREDDNLEFSVMQGLERPNHFVIVEGWKTAAVVSKRDQSAATLEFFGSLAPIRISPPDRHVVEPFTLGAAGKPDGDQVYMVEHIDFMPVGREAAPPLVSALAEATWKETGAVRYDVFRQLERRNNHYQVVSAWAGVADFRAHEAAGAARRFRAETSLGKPAERANLYDQRLYKGL